MAKEALRTTACPAPCSAFFIVDTAAASRRERNGSGQTGDVRMEVIFLAGIAGLILLLALRKPIEKAEGTEAEKSGEEVGA